MPIDFNNTYPVPLLNVAKAAGTDQVSGELVADYHNDVSLLVTNAGVTVGSPTSWTLDVKLQYSPDVSGTNWYDVTGGAITQQTASANELIENLSVNIARRIRVSYTLAFVGGTAPTLEFSVKLGLSQL